ncbi:MULTISPECIES: GNAT family N-acetyltransferase [Burkholderia]|uniref:RimJ/RimL family protein N-acetyltransferase n=1 Tax=Burkholderia pyrrocinia TaxID=60550 RepID=A0A318HYX2_BURPY|nr:MULTISPECIES: GNAT family N-acetyltransferase [Burkholderia]PXX21920.1 RimJ/RimL family protein N-acetyltransferase [Burkholderia pyrrocinia]SFW89940.1 Protein N-acetyltransferase, RimJ/RimL family [Burkholderia sp. NFACC33-1]SFY46371.1 Protein N-acetyltransferase, RimJ/RimL family [Burkholderia sp. NFPP32]
MTSVTPFKPPRLIETDTLLLRPLEFRDAEELFDSIFSDFDTMRDLAWRVHTHIEETRNFIALSRAGREAGTYVHWALECKQTRRITALIELRIEPPRIELGYVVCRRGATRRRRSGILALRKLTQWLINQPGIYRVFAHCSVDGRSHTMMERLGFELEGTVKSHEARPNIGVLAGDSYLYAMTRAASPLTVPNSGPVSPPSD